MLSVLTVVCSPFFFLLRFGGLTVGAAGSTTGTAGLDFVAAALAALGFLFLAVGEPLVSSAGFTAGGGLSSLLLTGALFDDEFLISLLADFEFVIDDVGASAVVLFVVVVVVVVVAAF